VARRALIAVALMAASACGGGGANSSTRSSVSRDSHVSGSITVSAAASLRDAFARLAAAFEAKHHGVDVRVNFDSSATLATQVIEGAPADVFASADEANMDKLTTRSLVAGSARIFANNNLVIVTKPTNPEKISGLADLADAGVISLCGVEVPCGRYAGAALGKAGVTIDESHVTRGQNVTATLNAVAEGDAVAGIVYSTDARSAGDKVHEVPIPAEDQVIAAYPIAVLAGSTNRPTAEAFTAFVLGSEGRKVLASYGFLPPT